MSSFKSKLAMFEASAKKEEKKIPKQIKKNIQENM